MTAPAPFAVLPLAVLGWALLLCLVAWGLRGLRDRPAGTSLGAKWWLLAALTLLSFRWPLLLVQHQLNPDESQLIAGAITLCHDPVFWRSVDGCTAGPVDFYPLLPAALGDGLGSYVVARLLALTVVWGTLVFAGESLARVGGAALARIVVLPAIAAVAFTTTPDFVFYSTELMPALLIAAAGYVAVKQQLAPSPRRLWLMGALLGSVPWGKLQAIPLAAVLWLLILEGERQAGRGRAALPPLCLGGLLPSFACFLLAALTGQLPNLYVPYLLNNVAYMGQPNYTWWDMATGQWANALFDGYLAYWLAGSAVCLIPLALWSVRAAPRRARRHVLATTLLLAAAIGCALAPRRLFDHYLQLLFPSVIWFTGALLALRWSHATLSGARLRLALCFLVCALAPQIICRVAAPDKYAVVNSYAMDPARRELNELIRWYSAPGEPLAIWGWRCALYVEAGRPQATRQAHTETQLRAVPRLRSYFIQRYLADLQAANPPVFADAVGPGNFAFVNRASAHESLPQLSQWVESHYSQVAFVSDVRLYVRNDRLATRGVPPASVRPHQAHD